VTPTKPTRFSLFAACPPGLEPILEDELKGLGWSQARAEPGGVALTGAWHDIWRLNLMSRCASRVLVRVAIFRAQHLSELEEKTGEADWREIIAPGTRIQVEAVCKRSKIYHSGAAEERVQKALQRLGAEPGAQGTKIFVRIENNKVEISADSSGDLLHKRGYKEDVVKAPLRETMAAAFLRFCDYRPGESLIDPMCGSGTIPIEAAAISAGLLPGAARAFAFESFPSFERAVFEGVKERAAAKTATAPADIIAGWDRQERAISAASANAERAGLAGHIRFAVGKVSELARPEGAPGLVLVNPPYGERLGAKADLGSLYAAFGQVMRERFAGWRVGLITADGKLAQATRLPFKASTPPIPHGAVRVICSVTDPLG
jgi:putative N6-adenine-specific DNA methylase